MSTIADGEIYATKLRAGDYKYPVKIRRQANRLWMAFPFNRVLLDAVKLMEGARWHGYEEPPIKQWTVADSPRNWFQIRFLEGKNPYARYDTPLLDFRARRPEAMIRQHEMIAHIITRQYCILAADMGAGKTFSVIEAMEWLFANRGVRNWFYVTPKSAMVDTRDQFEQWRALIRPTFYTYDALREIIKHWPDGAPPPQGAVFDECQRGKNPTSQRSQAMLHLANAIREHWGEQGAVIEMSGTPAPKSPLDWWHVAEIACPGFIKEGTYEKFRRRMAIMGEGKNDSGQAFAKLISWKDDERKCEVCGAMADDPDHDEMAVIEKSGHAFRPSVNEVARLYRCLNGLVQVTFIKDIVDLPEMRYKEIQLRPTQSIINAAKIIVATGGAASKVAILLRELSDGFQYQQQDVGTKVCPCCEGRRTREDWEYVGPEDQYENYIGSGHEMSPELFRLVEAACSYCGGSGEVTDYAREAVQVPCPKEDALREVLDQHEDAGRLITYAGFTGSVDRCVEISLREKWDVIRVDGRGWWSNVPGKTAELYKRFRYQQIDHPRINFVAQPSSGGVGLNLTASRSIVYYSNDHNGEARTQSEKRIHRIGMDVNRGATIIDLLHLPTDKLVLESLRRKRKLELITMGEFKDALDSPLPTEERQ